MSTWSIDQFPAKIFPTRQAAEQFIAKEGDFGACYRFSENGTDFNQTVVKTSESVVCGICQCIRRKVTRVGADPNDTLRSLKNTNKCSNPACQDYRDYLLQHQDEQAELLDFTSYVGERGYRTSQYPALGRLRFFDGGEWVIRD